MTRCTCIYERPSPGNAERGEVMAVALRDPQCPAMALHTRVDAAEAGRAR
jgi:hypothetical protein